MFAIVGRVPARGELVRHPSGVEFEVLDADPRRVKKLKIHRPRRAAGPAEAVLQARCRSCAWCRRKCGPVSAVTAASARDTSMRAPRVTGAKGWARAGIAFGAGALSVLALAPFFLWPVLFVTLPVLVWLIDGAVLARAPGSAG